jgi:peptide deformylase
MILPVVAYGDPVLKRVADPVEIEKLHSGEIKELVDAMFATMYNADGVGLAAPQIGKSIRVFIVDTVQLQNPEESKDFHGIRKAFINAEMLEETGEEWKYEEGCLSIPHIREDVSRQPGIKIRYTDVDGQEHVDTFDGITARVIQHEYDHIEGILFTDKINPLKKRLLQRKLDKISKGKVRVDYKMRFPALKRR